MQLPRSEALWLGLKITVHKGNSVEIGLMRELVGRCHFHHPVKHACPEGRIYRVPSEEIRLVLLVFGQSTEGFSIEGAEEGSVVLGHVVMRVYVGMFLGG